MDTLKVIIDSVAVNNIVSTAADYGFAVKSSIVMAIFILIQTVVRLTPTPKDDVIVSKIWKIVNVIFIKTNKKKS